MRLHTFLPALLLLSAATAARAGEFDLLLDTLKKGLPKIQNGAVVCNLDANKEQVREMAAAAHARGITLRFFNVTNAQQADSTSGTLRSGNADVAIILDKDPVLGAAGTSTKGFVAFLNTAGIPTVSTNESMLKFGVTMVVGGGKITPNGSKPKQFGIKL